MKVQFLQDYEAKTATGSRTIAAGTVLDLEEGKALRLIKAGLAKVVQDVSFNPDSRPYLDQRGRLVIPFDCPPKYRYWQGGQSLAETLKEIFEERAARAGGSSSEEDELRAATFLKYTDDKTTPSK